MTEDRFYDICDAAEAINTSVTGDYFPKVKDIEANIEAYGLESQVEMLAYFATNPFKRTNNPLMDEEDYINTVNYCKEALSKVNIVPEI